VDRLAHGRADTRSGRLGLRLGGVRGGRDGLSLVPGGPDFSSGLPGTPSGLAGASVPLARVAAHSMALPGGGAGGIRPAPTMTRAGSAAMTSALPRVFSPSSSVIALAASLPATATSASVLRVSDANFSRTKWRVEAGKEETSRYSHDHCEHGSPQPIHGLASFEDELITRDHSHMWVGVR
jgi:hypothetical protein